MKKTFFRVKIGVRVKIRLKIGFETMNLIYPEFLDNIFKMPIFKPKFNFFDILKANLVKHPERVMII